MYVYIYIYICWFPAQGNQHNASHLIHEARVDLQYMYIHICYIYSLYSVALLYHIMLYYNIILVFALLWLL